MKAGIVGLPNVGKSTLFNALTASKQAQAANYPFCTIEPNVGVISVPDGRLARISKYIVPKKLVPTALRLVDIAGIVKGASKGIGKGDDFLRHIREVDAILQVVRCFEDPNVLRDTEVDPLGDVELVELELMLADLQTLDGALPKAERAAKGGDKEAVSRVEAIKQCLAHLNADRPLRTLKLAPDLAKSIASFGLMTAKSILYVANVAEDDLTGTGPLVAKLHEFAQKTGAEIVPICAKLESEIAELEEPDRSEMLAASGLAEPALAVLARAAYKVLGLQSYFTAGETEVRAWTVPVGATAPEAAGVIHTDFEKGFIRAEIYTLDDLETHKTEKEIRAAGKLRVEGKAYVMRDGDICHFLTNR